MILTELVLIKYQPATKLLFVAIHKNSSNTFSPACPARNFFASLQCYAQTSPRPVKIFEEREQPCPQHTRLGNETRGRSCPRSFGCSSALWRLRVRTQFAGGTPAPRYSSTLPLTSPKRLELPRTTSPDRPRLQEHLRRYPWVETEHTANRPATLMDNKYAPKGRLIPHRPAAQVSSCRVDSRTTGIHSRMTSDRPKANPKPSYRAPA